MHKFPWKLVILLNLYFPVKNCSVENFSIKSLVKYLKEAAFTYLHCPLVCPLRESCCPSLHRPLKFTKKERLFIYILLPLSINPCPLCEVPMVQVSCKTFSCCIRVALSLKSVCEDLHTLALPSLHKGLVRSQACWSSVRPALPWLHPYSDFWAVVHSPGTLASPRVCSGEWRWWDPDSARAFGSSGFLEAFTKIERTRTMERALQLKIQGGLNRNDSR